MKSVSLSSSRASRRVDTAGPNHLGGQDCAGTDQAAKVGRVYRITSIVEGDRLWTMYARVQNRWERAAVLKMSHSPVVDLG